MYVKKKGGFDWQEHPEEDPEEELNFLQFARFAVHCSSPKQSGCLHVAGLLA